MTRFEQLRHFVAAEIVDLGIPEGALSAEDMRRTRIITLASLGVCIIAGIPSVLHLSGLGMTLTVAALSTGMAVAIANLIVLRRFRRPRPAAHLSLAILAGALIASHTQTGGFYDPSFAFIYVLPLAAAALIDMRGAAAWTVITIGVSITFWLLPDFGIVLVSQVPEAARPGNALFNRITTICTVGILGVSFVAGQRRAERQLATAHREVTAETAYVQLLTHAAVAANEAHSFESAIRGAVRRICEAMDWMAGHIYLVAEDGSIASSGMVYSRDQRVAALHEHAEMQQHQSGVGIVGRAVSEGKPQIILVPAPDDENSATAEAVRSGIQAAITVPVLVNGAVAAVMLFACPKQLENTARLEELFSLIGVQIGKVAERTALQERVQQTQKMEAVGQLAAGVAHEINNPMSYVRSNLHTLREEWQRMRTKLSDEDEEHLSDFEELIDESLEGVERTIGIVRDVKEFSHNGKVDREHWETALMGQLLDGALRVVATQAPAGVRIETSHTDESPCRCAPNQIRQVLVNLIVNAIQAVGESGCIVLSSGSDGKEVFARVEDNGPGMSAATRERLFEPFFTTKPVGEGTGLGLSVSYEIVRNHGGEILVSSEPGGGACFEVRLPVEPD